MCQSFMAKVGGAQCDLKRTNHLEGITINGADQGRGWNQRYMLCITTPPKAAIGRLEVDRW